MQTLAEYKHMTVVESALREIAAQLRIKNALEEFRLRKEYQSEDDAKTIYSIMEGR